MLELFHRIGTNLALAIQSAAELQMFTHGGGSHGESFDLGAAPVLFHLQNDPELLEYINRCDNNLDNLDYGAVRYHFHLTCHRKSKQTTKSKFELTKDLWVCFVDELGQAAISAADSPGSQTTQTASTRRQIQINVRHETNQETDLSKP